MQYEQALLSFERRYWTLLLDENGGSVLRAAKAAGVSRTGLYRALHRVGLPLPHPAHSAVIRQSLRRGA